MEERITKVGKLVEKLANDTPEKNKSLKYWYSFAFDRFYDMPEDLLNRIYSHHIGKKDKDSRS